MSNQGKGLVSSRIQLKILRNNLFAYLSCRTICRVIFRYLLANFQKISFNVISKVSVKGMDDDDDDDGGTAMKTMIISMITMMMVKRRKKYHDSCVPVSIAC